MRAAEILGARVFECGEFVGYVVDLRLTFQGGRLRLLGVVVGRSRQRVFSGHQRSSGHPWLIGRLLRMRDRGAFCVAWKSVQDFDEEHSVLRLVDGAERWPLAAKSIAAD